MVSSFGWIRLPFVTLKNQADKNEDAEEAGK